MSNKTLGPITIMPLDDLRQHVGGLIKMADGKTHPFSRHVLLSISEYLKDAARWHHIKHEGVAIPELGTPAEVQKFVDDHMRFTHERIVCTGEGRQDGISGGS